MLKHILKVFLILALVTLITLSTVTVSAATDDQIVPLTGNFSFGLSINNQQTGYFTLATGIGSSTAAVEQRTTGPKGEPIIQMTPGKTIMNQFTLKRGITNEKSMWDWRQQVVDNKISEARKDGSLVMYDRNYNPVAKWEFKGAWPSNISLETDENGIPVEVVTIVCNTVKRVI